MTSPQQPSTVELEVLYDRIRAGKVPGTDDLHITRSEFVAAINELRRQDMEYVIGEKMNVKEPQYFVPVSDEQRRYQAGYTVDVHVDMQLKRMKERLNEPE